MINQLQIERTLAIIKPDAVMAGNCGKILSMIENSGLEIVAMKMAILDKSDAMRFYSVHTGKYFFERLVNFITSGKIIAIALQGDHAIERWRTLMGATDPAEAAEGTIRHLYGTFINKNCVHGSDSPDTAHAEIDFFFTEHDFVPSNIQQSTKE